MTLSPLASFDGWVQIAVVPAGGLPPEMSVPLADIQDLILPAEPARWVAEHAGAGEVWAAVAGDCGDLGDAVAEHSWALGRESCLAVHTALVRAAERHRHL